MDVAIIDYKMSNLFSVQAACNKVGLSSIITSDRDKILEAKVAILPGVGAFGEAMKYLIDKGSFFNEIGRFAAYEMYEEYGNISAAGVIVGIGDINNKKCVIVANDATVKAGAYFEVTLKKTLRAQQIAIENNLPIVYLVDSAGVFLPLQDQVFPDEGHFGKIFYNNARMSAKGITQIACVMGPCVAGGAYLHLWQM